MASKTKPRVEHTDLSVEEYIKANPWIGWYFVESDPKTGEKTLHVCPKPKMVGDGDTLHNDAGKAVEWENGVGFYYLHNVEFSEDLWRSIVDKTITAEEALAIPNADQRSVAVRMLGANELIRGLKAKLVDTGIKGTELYRVNNYLDSGVTNYFMKMDDVSTDRVFVEWVEPRVATAPTPRKPDGWDADYCQAVAWDVPLDLYLAIPDSLEG